VKYSFKITENSKKFNPVKNLTQKPFSFETKRLIGNIFYMPSEGLLGGDGFIIQEKNKITISLLEDMAGHGEEGRKAIRPFIQKLQELVDQKNWESKKSLIEKIIKLDKEVSYEKAIAATIINIDSENNMKYCNFGENKIILKQYSEIKDISDICNKGKRGFLNLIYPRSGDLMNNFQIGECLLKKSDSIYLMTDGVYELTDIAKIKKIIGKANLNTKEGIMSVNSESQKIINKKISKNEEMDDYTIIGLEIK